MTAYTLALFVHIAGALALGTTTAISLVGLIAMRRAPTAEQARLWARFARQAGRLTPLAALLLLAPGVYLVVSAWGWATPWIDISLGAVLILPLLRHAVLDPCLTAVATGAPQAAGDPIPADIQRQRIDPLLWGASGVTTGLFLAIVFLMTVKPDLGGALTTVGVALVAGAVPAVLTSQRRAGSTTEPLSASCTPDQSRRSR